MSIPHLLLTAPATCLAVRNLFFGAAGNPDVLTFEQAPATFTWSWAQLVVFGISHAFDVFDIFQWYVLKSRKVLRSQKHLRHWKEQGRLKPSVGNIQWLMVRGVPVDPDCDEFGFLKDKLLTGPTKHFVIVVGSRGKANNGFTTSLRIAFFFFFFTGQQL